MIGGAYNRPAAATATGVFLFRVEHLIYRLPQGVEGCPVNVTEELLMKVRLRNTIRIL